MLYTCYYSSCHSDQGSTNKPGNEAKQSRMMEGGNEGWGERGRSGLSIPTLQRVLLNTPKIRRKCQHCPCGQFLHMPWLVSATPRPDLTFLLILLPKSGTVCSCLCVWIKQWLFINEWFPQGILNCHVLMYIFVIGRIIFLWVLRITAKFGYLGIYFFNINLC